MATIQEKLELIVEACKAATQMESRGGLMHKYEPEVSLEVSIDGAFDFQTGIHLRFNRAEDKQEWAGNWGGGGDSLEESLNSNLLCLSFELEERIKRLNVVLDKLKPLVAEAYPKSDGEA